MIRTVQQLPRSVLSLIAAAVFWLGASLAAQAQDAAPEDFVGDWGGELNLGRAKIPLVFHIGQDEDGSLVATMDSPAQGALGLPVSRVTVRGRTITLRVQTPRATFEGDLSEDGQRLTGQWIQGGRTWDLEVTKDAVATVERPQHPVAPFPYRVEPLVFDSAEAGIRLAGTLTRPDGDGAFPAVVLVSGSGPQDRDSTIFGHKIFWVLADYLTRRGIAVLRFDERGVGGSTGDFAAATSHDFAKDVIGAARYLSTRDDIDAGKIGIVGLSEGGLIGPLAAVQEGRIAFLVLMAPTGVPIDRVLIDQARIMARMSGAPADMIDQQSALQERIFEILRSTDDLEEARAQIQTELITLGVPADQALAQSKGIATPWWQTGIRIDPAEVMRQLEVPVLVMNGTKDVQVSIALNFPPIEAALKEAGVPFRMEQLEGLNHLFQTAETGLPLEYQQIEETMSPRALDMIGDWVLEQAGTE